MKQIYILVLLFVFLLELKVNAKEYESPVYTQCVAEVTSTFLKEVYKEYGFECGASGGEMPYDVEEISVKIVAYQNATIEEARELEVILTEKFTQIINSHEKIRPFLREFPFPSSRARVSISFRSPKKKFSLSSKNDVKYVLQVKGIIYYQADNPDNPYVYRDIKDEPYEEALKIVRNNASKNDSM